MREVSRSKGPSKIYLVSESRKSFNGLEFSWRQLLQSDSPAVIPDSFNHFNSLAESEHSSICIAKRQNGCGVGQMRVDFDPGGPGGNNTNAGVESLRVKAAARGTAEQCADSEKQLPG